MCLRVASKVTLLDPNVWCCILLFLCTLHLMYSLVQWNWFSDVTDACNSGASGDHREPISLHQAVLLMHTWSNATVETRFFSFAFCWVLLSVILLYFHWTPPPPKKKTNLKLVRIIFVLSKFGEENDVEIQWLQSKKKFSFARTRTPWHVPPSHMHAHMIQCNCRNKVFFPSFAFAESCYLWCFFTFILQFSKFSYDIKFRTFSKVRK